MLATFTRKPPSGLKRSSRTVQSQIRIWSAFSVSLGMPSSKSLRMMTSCLAVSSSSSRAIILPFLVMMLRMDVAKPASRCVPSLAFRLPNGVGAKARTSLA